MAKIMAPDKHMVGLNLETPNGVKKVDAKNGSFEVTNTHNIAALKAEGFFEAPLASFGHVKGFPCACGFNSVFRKCGRCGADN
jgi:hypothetical protein